MLHFSFLVFTSRPKIYKYSNTVIKVPGVSVDIDKMDIRMELKYLKYFQPNIKFNVFFLISYQKLL